MCERRVVIPILHARVFSSFPNAFGLSVKIVDISMYHLSCKTWFYGAVKKALSLDMEE